MTGRHHMNSADRSRPDRSAVPLPPEMPVDDVLRQLPRRGFTLLAYGDRTEPDPLVAYRRLGDHVDVLVIRGADRVGVYRAAVPADEDPLTVETVQWCTTGGIAEMLYALLTLWPVDPAWPDYAIPPEVAELLPPPGQLPVTMRPPQ